MSTQAQIPFPTESPINVGRLSGQNLRLYNWLMEGNTINCMSPAMSLLEIGYINSRISDLRNKFKVPIEKRFIKVPLNGEDVTVREYWIKEENRKQSKMAA